MKTRAEVLREKREREAVGKGAEERAAAPAEQDAGAMVHCGACGDDFAAGECSARADGTAECPGCGAPLGFRVTGRTKGEPAAEGPKDPERKWCGECGSEWPVVSGRFVINCGHMTAERVDDPRKAKRVRPPAGLQTRTEKEVARRDAEGAAAPEKGSARGSSPEEEAPPRRPASGPGAPVVSGNRLSIPWGEARCPIDQWNNFKVGGHIITVELPEGADRLEAARKIIDDLEAIADLMFKRQKAWYERKLKELGG